MMSGKDQDHNSWSTTDQTLAVCCPFVLSVCLVLWIWYIPLLFQQMLLLVELYHVVVGCI